MARPIEKEYLKDIQKLIKCVTSFEEREENFGLCTQFALSNLKYHRFLDVDSHKVIRSFQGVCDKLRIHSESSKYQKLKDLTDQFLEAPVFEKKGTGKTDTHYSILSFLLLIANNPVNSEYVDTRRPNVTEAKDDFDWGKYLLEGIEVYTPSDEDSSDWTDEDDTLEEQDMRVPSLGTKTAQETARVRSPDNQQLVYNYRNQDNTSNHWEESSQMTSSDWLTRNLVAQYWKGEPLEIEAGKYRSCHFNNDWETFKQRLDPFYSNREKTMVTENILMREIVWMLMGLKKLHLFHFNGRYFVPKPGLAVLHLSDEALRTFLADFMKYGACVQMLQNFVSDCYHGNSSGDGDVVCQTYQSFATTVADFLQSLKTDLSKVEQKLIRQEEIVTLLTLTTHLAPLMHQIGLVYMVYVRGVHHGREYDRPSQRATLLLNTLYSALMGTDTLFEMEIKWEGPNRHESGLESPEQLKLLLSMWIQTCRPFINIIDSWISHGNLRDPKEEFIIQRNKDVTTLDETYWEKSFTFHSMVKLHQLDRAPDKQTNNKQEEESECNTMDWAPKFLQPVLQKVVLTGKSMEMLEGLGKLAESDGKASIDVQEFKEGHLYEKFLNSLQDLLGSMSPETTEKKQEETTQEEQLFSPEMDRQLKERGIYDNFLKMHFEDLMRRSKESHSILEESFVESLQQLDTDSLQPLELILKECLYPHIHRQYERVCRKLVDVLKTDYKLLDYLAAMRKFFLMEAGDSMFDFYTEIFDKIRLHEHWKDTTSVTWALHEALDTRYPEEIPRLSVVVETNEGQMDTQPISATNCLKLQYEIPSLVDVVINERCQQIYNQIFSFLLQVKRAKYCLDELRFYDLAKESVIQSDDPFLLSERLEHVPRAAKIHRMHLLRFRLLSFVNGLHNYIMTRILHSTGLEFLKDLETATDLDQVIEIHAGYVWKIHVRCLLHSKNTFLKEAVLKVLNLSLRFQREWDQGIDHITLKQIEKTETEFSRCIQFLSSFLNSVIRRGSFPHLESLAFDLDNLIQKT